MNLWAFLWDEKDAVDIEFTQYAREADTRRSKSDLVYFKGNAASMQCGTHAARFVFQVGGLSRMPG